MGPKPNPQPLATVHPLPARPSKPRKRAVQRLKFSAAKLDGLTLPEPGAAPIYYYDQTQPKLAVSVSAGGVKTFYCITKARGQRRKFSARIGRYDNGETRIEAARDAVETMLTRLASGESPAIVHHAPTTATTHREAFTDFKENKRNKGGAFLSEVTKRGYSFDFDNHLGKLADRPLGSITHDDAVALHLRIGRNHPTTANRVAALGSSIYNYAITRKLYVGANPFAGIEKFAENKRERFIVAEEFPAFMAALAATPEPWRWIFSLGLFTGVRRSNLLAARWPDFNIPARHWRIPITKSGKPVTVSLSAEALAVLKQIPRVAGSEYLFPSHGDAGHVREPKKAWKDLLNRAGLTDLRLHDVRRTFGSYQAMTGASLPIIGKSLGHSTPQATQVYARLQTQPVEEAIATATTAMMAAARKGKGNRGAAINKVLGKRTRQKAR